MSKKSEKKKKKRAKELPTEVVYHESGSRATVKLRGFTMRGLEQQLIHAARQFERDYKAAYVIKSPAMTVKVDGGGQAHQQHIVRLAAQERLVLLQSKIGEPDFRVLTAVVIYNAGPEAIHKQGGPKIVAVTHDIKRILANVSGFYTGHRGRDRMLEAADRIIEAAARDLEIPSPSSAGNTGLNPSVRRS